MKVNLYAMPCFPVPSCLAPPLADGEILCNAVNSEIPREFCTQELWHPREAARHAAAKPYKLAFFQRATYKMVHFVQQQSLYMVISTADVQEYC